MNITKPAVAGTLESSDALIRVAPAENLEIEINSSVKAQFGDDIYQTVQAVLSQLNVTNAHIIIEDKGALDCVLRARLKATLMRATDESIEWEKLL
ncbi:citrate lyase acyl carrier protein [Ursidibacter sp. B-7004-1]